jgi:hypothetical protein
MSVLPHRTARIVSVLAVGAVALVVTAAAGPAGATGTPPTSTAPPMTIGATHTAHSADSWNPKTAVDRAVSLAHGTTQLGNQHIMGWGAGNPEPSPGVWDFASLDARVALIRRTQVQPVLTLCCSPDWMKGGRPGSTDWTKLEVAPTPDHYDDFAALAVTIAKRYPDVKYFQVWNELKGFWNPATNNWNIAAYTALYNKVYLALKAYNPNLKVGGPYVPMTSFSSASTMSNPSTLRGPWGVLDQRALDAVQYWLSHAVGADFIDVDGGTATADKGLIASTAAGNDKFTAVTAWLRSRTTLPIWWAEIYSDTRGNEAYDTTARGDSMIDALAKIARAGGAVALLWQPEGPGDINTAGLWSPTTVATGGQPTPFWTHLYWAEITWAKNGVKPPISR